MLGLCVEVRDLYNSVSSKPYPGILRLGIRCQNHRLSGASSYFFRPWLALFASGEHQRLQGAHTKSEAPVQHLKPLSTTRHTSPFLLGLLQMTHLVLLSILGQSLVGFRQNPWLLLCSFFFPFIFSLCPNWLKAAVSKNTKLSCESDSGTFEKSYPEINTLVYTGSIRKGWFESLLCEIVGGIKCEQWEESWWSTPYSDALVGNQALLIMDVLEWSKVGFISPVTVALQETHFPWESPCCEQCQHILLAQKWWRLAWHWWSQECGWWGPSSASGQLRSFHGHQGKLENF